MEIKKFIVKIENRGEHLIELRPFRPSAKSAEHSGYLIFVDDLLAYRGKVFSFEEAMGKIDLVKNAKFVATEVIEVKVKGEKGEGIDKRKHPKASSRAKR